jgi:hypothetical protein
VFTRARHWYLSSARCIQSTAFHPISIKSILISYRLRLGLSVGLFPSGFRCLGRYKEPRVLHFVTSCFSLMVRSWSFSQPPSWETTSRRLSATAYSIYPQLLSISEGRLIHSQLEDAPCHGDRDPHNMALETHVNCYHRVNGLSALLKNTWSKLQRVSQILRSFSIDCLPYLNCLFQNYVW